MDMGPEMGTYQMFGRGGGIPNGGIMKPQPGAPAAWMPYALVKDAKAAAAAATANGGQIVNGPMEVPGGDWIAVGIDPQGAMFAVHSLNPAGPQQPIADPNAVTARKAAPAKKKTAPAKAAAPKKAAPKKAAPKKAARKAAKKAAKKSAPMKAKAKTAKKSQRASKPSKKKVAKKAARRKK
jgi:predicted enzyme related to lactoylglutathione lyase